MARCYLEKVLEDILKPIKEALTSWDEKGEELSDYARAMEEGLGKAYEGAWSKMNKLTNSLLQKTKRHLKQSHPEMISDWTRLTNAVRPEGILQERYASTLSLIVKKNHSKEALITAFNPLIKDFISFLRRSE